MVELREIIKETFTGTLITKSQITSEGVPCIKCGDIYTIYEIWCDKVNAKVKLEEGKKYRYCFLGDLLFASASVIFRKVGKAIAYLGENPIVIDSDIIVLRHEQNPKYLAYVLSSTNIEIQKEKLCNKNSTVTHISVDQLSKLKIPLPPLKKQKQIADWLDKFRELTNSITKGLPREISLLKQQSRYYRERLIG